MAKTVPASKFQEWKGLDRISLTVHEMKCIFREISKDDFGLDGEIEVVIPKPNGDGYQTTGGIIKVQAKSGASYITQDSDTKFAARVSKEDLELWYQSNFPTLFIIYHPSDDRLYWKEMRSYVKYAEDVWQAPFKIVFDKSADEFSVDAYERLSAIADVSAPRITTASRERYISNLLRVNRLPWVWSAPTTYHDRNAVRRIANKPTPPFTLYAGRLYTFADLKDEQCKLRDICDLARIRVEKREHWWKNPELTAEYVFLLNQLLGIHMESLGIKYNRHFRRNYFPREDHDATEFQREWYNVRTKRRAQRTVVRYYEYGIDRFWRHKAVDLSFQRIGSSWYLRIIPKYFFTHDGETPYDSDRVGALTTKIKSREWNYHVLNDVLFWSDVLANNQSDSQETAMRLGPDVVLTLDRMPAHGFAGFSIPSDPALYEEPDLPEQLDLLTLIQPEDDEDENEY